MKIPYFRALTAAGLIAALTATTGAAEKEPPPATPAPATPSLTPKGSGRSRIKYEAPPSSLGGPPVRTEGGGTRSAGGAPLPWLKVLAPDHVALTTQAQPILFWFQSEPSTAGFQITVTEAGKARPVLKIKLDDAKQAGIRALPLSRHAVTLTAGVKYRWNVVLIPDPANHSKDVLASGVIQRVEAPELSAKVSQASPRDRALLYADAGYWYDSLQSISTAISADPKDSSLREMRNSLLRQVGLADVAATGGR